MMLSSHFLYFLFPLFRRQRKSPDDESTDDEAPAADHGKRGSSARPTTADMDQITRADDNGGRRGSRVRSAPPLVSSRIPRSRKVDQKTKPQRRRKRHNNDGPLIHVAR